MSPWPVQRDWTVDGAPLNPHPDSRQQVVVKPVACWDGSGEGQALEGSLAGGTAWTQRQHLLGRDVRLPTQQRPLRRADRGWRRQLNTLKGSPQQKLAIRTKVPKVFVRGVGDGGDHSSPRSLEAAARQSESKTNSECSVNKSVRHRHKSVQGLLVSVAAVETNCKTSCPEPRATTAASWRAHRP